LDARQENAEMGLGISWRLRTWTRINPDRISVRSFAIIIDYAGFLVPDYRNVFVPAHDTLAVTSYWNNYFGTFRQCGIAPPGRTAGAIAS